MRNYRSVDRASLHPSMTHVKLQKDDCMPHDMLNSIAQRRNTTTNTYGRLRGMNLDFRRNGILAGNLTAMGKA
jgi:hypothetical protein